MTDKKPENSPDLAIEDNPDGSKRTIGILSGSAISISLMIGSGIFSTPSSVARISGTPLMAIILYIIGGICSFGGALAFIEVGIMFPKNGGTLRYLAHQYLKPRLLISYLFAWCMIVCIRPGAIAANGPVFAQYWMYAAAGGDDMETLHPTIYAHRDWIYRGIAAAGITFVSLICMFSVKWSLRLLNVLTTVKILVLLTISITGIVALAGGVKKVPDAGNWSMGFSGSSAKFAAYAVAMNRVFWAYDGWSNICYSTGEMKNPRRSLPIAAGLGVITVTILYLLAIFAYFSVVPLQEAIQAKEILAAVFTNKIFGETVGKTVLPIFIGLSVFGAVLAQVFSIGRIVQTAAAFEYIPYGRVLAQYNKKYNTPMNAIIFNYVLSMVYLFAPPPGDVFELLVDFVQYPTWVFYGLTALGVIFLRRRLPNFRGRRFKANIVLLLLFVLVTVYLSILPFVKTDATSGTYPYYLSPLLGVVSIAVGFIPWYFRMWWYADRKGVDFTSWIYQEEEEFDF
ncbi:High-affinity methionine permease [Zancudomyces culisetae]|uniref:High-affinity methionine permease n=1 Tax=Zancudomyces culisetae TaxID=1213189 RepID=A0A1R1PR96_ZANCU|nr:High-affinity methionine permease [Zancudomyces culisetae]|eukprot:OMH83490.1 High-affinity methionine permease [Zancudomyces culisetae]